MTTPTTTAPTTTATKLANIALVLASISLIAILILLATSSVINPLIGAMVGWGGLVIGALAVMTALIAWVVGKRLTGRIVIAALIAVVPSALVLVLQSSVR
ncbi:MAG TPA: hypothetical protein VFU07_06170 [Candidatus Lumbricidophila sp.]|nr:hypothetical protein [Candidatus Lumbricidophila sp.]